MARFALLAVTGAAALVLGMFMGVAFGDLDGRVAALLVGLAAILMVYAALIARMGARR